MILSKSTIEELADDGLVEPEPVEAQFQPASLDLRLGEELYDVGAGVYQDDLTIHPGRLYLGHTMDYVTMPDDVAAFITGRSSVGRRGVVVHLTAGWVDNGFEGEITLEIFNYNSRPIRFDAGDRICQLIFFPVEDATIGYDGQYVGQTGIEEAGEI